MNEDILVFNIAYVVSIANDDSTTVSRIVQNPMLDMPHMPLGREPS